MINQIESRSIKEIGFKLDFLMNEKNKCQLAIEIGRIKFENFAIISIEYVLQFANMIENLQYIGYQAKLITLFSQYIINS